MDYSFYARHLVLLHLNVTSVYTFLTGKNFQNSMNYIVYSIVK